MAGVRGYCLAFLAAFDKHWNLALEDVREVWTRRKRSKVPALGKVVVQWPLKYVADTYGVVCEAFEHRHCPTWWTGISSQLLV
jgi:hypothetical protein